MTLKLKAALCGVALVAGCAGSAMAQTRFTISANGEEVTDSKTSLTWRRCVSGMTWTGSACGGAASLFTHEQALAHAQAQSGWRLPNVKELASLVDETRIDPAIDTSAFPNTPSEEFWVSTPQASNNPIMAWMVEFYSGVVSDYIGSSGDRNVEGKYVRLVRSTP